MTEHEVRRAIASPTMNLSGEGALPIGAEVTVLSANGERSSIAVEALVPGDRLLTLPDSDDERSLIVAIHRFELDPSANPIPALGTPIRILAGALAQSVPENDLVLLPEALLAFSNDEELPIPAESGGSSHYLVPAAALVNGVSVIREPPSGRQIWLCPDLGRHAVIIVEATATGSARAPSAMACATIHLPGPKLNSLRTYLATRADIINITPVLPERRSASPQPPPPPSAAASQASPHPPAARAPESDQEQECPIVVVAAGTAVPLSDRPSTLSFAYELPPRTGPVRLRARPRRAEDAADGRRFGVCVFAVSLNDEALRIDAPAFGPGFHPVESNNDTQWRWTNGDAWLVLPYSVDPRRLVVRISDWHTALIPV